jgi:hypothetical protein
VFLTRKNLCIGMKLSGTDRATILAICYLYNGTEESVAERLVELGVPPSLLILSLGFILFLNANLLLMPSSKNIFNSSDEYINID